jgi:hypothetical protein
MGTKKEADRDCIVFRSESCSEQEAIIGVGSP